MLKRPENIKVHDIIKKHQLLIVDDNPININILKNILECDYDIITACNGKEALDKLNNHDYNNQISAVVLDILMPVIDGFEVLKQMRCDDYLKQIPIIIASDKSDNQEDKALALGANDYIIKPYSPNILKMRIHNAIYLHDTSKFVTTMQNDNITGLFSKDYFYIKAKEILNQNSNNKYDIICCDIEKFKLVNDLYGRDVGDNLLKCCAKIFKQIIKNLGICGRISGDVFAMLIIHQDVSYTAYFNKINEQINQLQIGLYIQLKFGVYPVNDVSEPVYLMCDRARLAINLIKGIYGINYKYYDNKMRKSMIEEQYITSSMERALKNHEFEVYFQPKYEIRTSKIIGAEALVRWNDPQKGLISPDKFIPLFEQNGFINELDQFVWDKTLETISKWIDDGNTPVPISVNVSRTDLYNPNIDKLFLKLIRKYNILPNLLHLEITESAYTENSKQIIDTVQLLKSLGFKIEMDDFGTGYSSLNMLADLPIDILKLDIGFMQNKEQYNSRSILSFTISLAKWMNLEVIAEGAETKSQIELLKSLGCDYVQGYYYSKPLKSQEFIQLLYNQQLKYSDSNATITNNNIKITSPILLINGSDEDRTFLNNIIGGQYNVFPVGLEHKIYDVILTNKNSLSLVLISYNKNITIDQTKKIICDCNSCNIPVITILPDKTMSDTMIELGAKDFITKPFSAKSTLNRIDVIINNAKLSEEVIQNEISVAISEMKRRAEQDSLTGLLNHAEFESQVKNQLANSDCQQAYMIMLDIDNFKSINDTCGHYAGDNALKALANSLHKIFKGNCILGRMGGDEFSVYIPKCNQKSEIQSKTEKLCNSISWEIKDLKISCSAGICAINDCDRDFVNIYEKADIALLASKRNGKGQSCIYKEGMELPIDSVLEKNVMNLLDNTTDATFVCDDNTNQIIYINDTACKIVGKSRNNCLNSKCYELLWNRCKICDRCHKINNCKNCFYEEDMFLNDGITKVHLKAKFDTWGERKVKIHYIHKIR